MPLVGLGIIWAEADVGSDLEFRWCSRMGVDWCLDEDDRKCSIMTRTVRVVGTVQSPNWAGNELQRTRTREEGRSRRWSPGNTSPDASRAVRNYAGPVSESAQPRNLEHTGVFQSASARVPVEGGWFATLSRSRDAARAQIQSESIASACVVRIRTRRARLRTLKRRAGKAPRGRRACEDTSRNARRVSKTARFSSPSWHDP